MKTIMLYPGLVLRKGSDGHWLSFDGGPKKAVICLENQRGITAEAMVSWARNTFREAEIKGGIIDESK